MGTSIDKAVRPATCQSRSMGTSDDRMVGVRNCVPFRSWESEAQELATRATRHQAWEPGSRGRLSGSDSRMQARLCVESPPCADALQGTQDANSTGRRHKGTRRRHARTSHQTPSMDRCVRVRATWAGRGSATGLTQLRRRQSEGLLHAGCGWQVAGQRTEALTMNSYILCQGARGVCGASDRGPQRSIAWQ